MINKVDKFFTAGFVICMLAAIIVGRVHPFSYFTNRTVHRVTPDAIADGRAHLPWTRWVEFEGRVVPGSMYEHCHRIYSFNLGDYNTYLIYQVRGRHGTVTVRDHIDRQVSGSTCETRMAPILQVTKTRRVQGHKFLYFKKPGAEGDEPAYELGVPETVRVRGMLRYTLRSRLPRTSPLYEGMTWKSPYVVYGEAPSDLSTILFLASLAFMAASLRMQFKYGADEFVAMTCTLEEPGRTWKPGDTLKYRVVVNVKKGGLQFASLTARLQGMPYRSLSSKPLHEETQTLLTNRVAPGMETLTFEGAFVMPRNEKFYTAKGTLSGVKPDWDLLVKLDIVDHLEIEKTIHLSI